MKTQLHTIFVITCILVVTACSVNQKPMPAPIIIPELPQPPSAPPSTIEIVPAQVIQIPKVKPPLTQSELFTRTLSSHNRVRAKHRLPPLKWSNKLAAYSKQWVDHLGSGPRCTMKHRSGVPPYGENLYWSSAVVWSDGVRETNRVTIRDVVKVWADEERWYNYNRNNCQPGQRCGHYTQIVWRDTTEVGCAMKVCGDKSQTWVCSYNPPGNYTGVRPY